MWTIREEAPEHHAAIREVNQVAFGGNVEAHLVDRLRAEGLVVASLVALEGAHVVGHILFSELPFQAPQGILPAVSLAPMAVRPNWQRRGIGSALVRAGLAACRERGKLAVLVVGHPHYYPRFGFSADLAKSIRSPFSGEAWMAAELVPGSLSHVSGSVCYPGAFDVGDPEPLASA